MLSRTLSGLIGAGLVAVLLLTDAQGQESGGAVALQKLSDGDVEKALAALGPAADGRSWLPENEKDPALPAAAGGLFRALAQEDADLRFELLSKWTMPEGDRQSVRLLTAIVPQDAPPQAFARVIGERPRDSTFAVAEINGIRGLFSSGWLLVTAAEEAGRLRKLTTDLESLEAAAVPGASTLLQLAHMAEAKPDIESLKSWLSKRAGALKEAASKEQKEAIGVYADALELAAAALKHSELRGISEQILESLVELTLSKPSPRLRPFLRVAHATAIQLNRGESGPGALRQNRLKYWIPVSGKTSTSSALGAVDAMWLTHEDHILHLAGAGQDALQFRYPLSGDFNFLCETQEGGDIGTDGGLTFGGLYFEALGSNSQLTVQDADAAFSLKRPCPFVRHENRPIFNRVSIRTRPAVDGKPTAAQFLANLHPMWTDELSGTSPWLGLRGLAEKRPIFRNLKLTGSPVIPREVSLAAGHQLRGWVSNFYGETQPAFHAGGTLSIQSGTISAARPETPAVDAGAQTEAPATTPLDVDWQIAGGVITAAKHDPQEGRTTQSVLRYQRPLLDGESVSYEFEYQPGSVEVHPALGRLALLIESGGVRIHWMTDGNHEWSGLPEDNATLEPLSRRGGRQIPLKEGDWNAVTLARADGKLKLTLNGTLIYERVIDFGGDLQFGLYRDRTKHSVNVRNVIMTGDWPETIPADCLENPTIVIDEPAAAGDRKVSQRTFGEPALADNARAVRVAAAQLATPAEQFAFLSKWVLPGSGRSEIRMSGVFTPVDAPPDRLIETLGTGSISVPSVPLWLNRRDGEPQSHRGNREDADAKAAQLVSPVFDLLDTARQLNQLADLRGTVEQLPTSREQLALLALVDLEAGDVDLASTSVDQFFTLLPSNAPDSLDAMWPETLLVWRALFRSQTNESIGEVIGLLHQQRTQRAQPAGIEFWHTHIARLMNQHDLLINRPENSPSTSSRPALTWIPAVRERARSRGVGAAPAIWTLDKNNEVHHVSGHQEEFLLYPSPLRGDFDLTCQIGGYGQTQVLFAGEFAGISSSATVLESGSFLRGTSSRKEVDPAFSRPDPWINCCISVRDDVCNMSLNGRIVRSDTLPPHFDPWFGIHSWYRNNARLRDVRITGSPIVPEEVTLSADPDMSSWLTYHEETSGFEGARWTWEADPDGSGIINGQRGSELFGTQSESLLRYLRPLTEGGSIEYDFQYEPGNFETHPALDRLAFLLQPDGVRLHWITDERFDQTGVPPANEFDGGTQLSTPLPLKPGEWNRMQLSIVGDVVTIGLNGQSVFELDLQSLVVPNHRTFGLFHFADRSAVRVRNVVMRGNWPKTIPRILEQPLADQTVPRLNAERAGLAVVYRHNFTRDGLGAEHFQLNDPKRGATVTQSPDGLRIVRPAQGSWTSTDLRSQFVLRGNFDVEATFDRFRYSGAEEAVVFLVVRFSDAQQQHARAQRGRARHQQRQLFHAARLTLNPDGSRSFHADTVTCEANSGRLRLARRGDEIYFLFAEGDSANFRLAGIHKVTDADSLGVDLTAVANGTATVDVVWKDITIAAEELLLPPDPTKQPQNEIFVMNIDGSNLRSITGHDPNLGGAGSPDWSPDGKQIAFDIFSGTRTGNYLINVDGTGLKYLGPGCMPTFGSTGDRLAFTWSGRGMTLMDSAGENREVLTSDGWGAQFSPNGKWVAYQSYERTPTARSTNITIIDGATKEKRVLLEGDQAQRYSSIYWNMEWSPDSQQICFKGRIRNASDRYETAITSIDGSSQGFRVLTTETTDTDFGWHPDGTRILLAKTSPKYLGGPRLFVADLKTDSIDLLETQPLDMPNHSGIWSPDGKQIAFVTRRKPEPIPWRPVAAASNPAAPDDRQATEARSR